MNVAAQAMLSGSYERRRRSKGKKLRERSISPRNNLL